MSALLLTGVGLRTPHYNEIIDKRPGLAWLEVHSENFFADGGKPLHTLEKIRQFYPLSLHGVGLSIGSMDELNWQHLKNLRDLITFIDPCLISDHLSWSSFNGHYLHDLLPLPYTEEVLDHVVNRVQQIQEYLKRQILIENISSYIRFANSTLSEYDFLSSVAKKSGCGILLDINNMYVNATNHGENPSQYLTAIPPALVQEIHLAGFTSTSVQDNEILIDSHNRPVFSAVWDLYRQAIQQLGHKPTIIEWDSDIPTLERLFMEAHHAEQIMREANEPSKPTS